jgi:hypothetical protein
MRHSALTVDAVRFNSMKVWFNMRAIVALAAAYAVVVQATLLAIGGFPAGSASFAAGALCAQHKSAPVQAPPGAGEHSCLAACLACCCGVSVPPAPVPALAYRSALSRPITVAAAIDPVASFRSPRAHRSRAPPLG